MQTALQSMFSTVTPSTTGGANQLQLTARLTKVSEGIMAEILTAVADNDTALQKSIDALEAQKLVTTDLEVTKTLDEQLAVHRDTAIKYQARLLESQKSHDVMDALIGENFNLGNEDLEWLKKASKDDLEKMIRSQQSKRSRAKSKQMDFENYQVMMVGAIAENLLRLAMNKPKASGGGAAYGELGYTAEDIQKLIDFPDDLVKEIRNVQSKKSIMKSKAGFSETDERWLQLLAAESQLKNLRDSKGVSTAVMQEMTVAVEIVNTLRSLFEGKDLNDIPSDDVKAMLEMVAELIAVPEAVEPEEAEEVETEETTTEV